MCWCAHISLAWKLCRGFNYSFARSACKSRSMSSLEFHSAEFMQGIPGPSTAVHRIEYWPRSLAVDAGSNR
jgi:hypothetical protein